MKEIFEKVDFEKIQQMTKNMNNFLGGKELTRKAVVNSITCQGLLLTK